MSTIRDPHASQGGAGVKGGEFRRRVACFRGDTLLISPGRVDFGRGRALDFDALLESVDQRHEGFGGGDVGVSLAGQFDQFHRLVALLAPGDEDLQGFALEGFELGLRPPGLGAERKGLELALQLETGGRLTYLAVELSMASAQIRIKYGVPTNHPHKSGAGLGLDSAAAPSPAVNHSDGRNEHCGPVFP